MPQSPSQPTGLTIGQLLRRVFKRPYSFVVEARKLNHVRYLLVMYVNQDSPRNDGFFWEKEGGMKLMKSDGTPDPYYSYETADWSFGEWITK